MVRLGDTTVAMTRTIACALLALAAACGSSKDDAGGGESFDDMKTSAEVDWARKQLPELDQQLASADPGKASSACAVIKPDMPKIRKADPKLAETLARRCGRDLAVRSLTVAVERAEADRGECSMISVYEKMITEANAGDDPEVAKLRERVAAACKK